MRVLISEYKATQVAAYIHEVALHCAKAAPLMPSALEYPSTILLCAAQGLDAKEAAKMIVENHRR